MCILAKNQNINKMILTTAIIISVLVFINFLLLKFSSNKVVRTTSKNKKPVVLKPEISIKPISNRLAPTGS